MKYILINIIIICNTVISYSNLSSISSFGSNPGNLNAYFYSPSNITSTAPLVVVCHGCNQNAQEMSNRTEWNKLADAYGFKVLYPEQKSLNNINKCFNWFNSFDNERGVGELASIKQMIDYMKTNQNIDDNRIYITGMSAGAAIAVSFAASYPDVINRVAPIAGVPYKSASSSMNAFYAMNPGFSKTPTEWGDKIRNANVNYNGNYPKMVILHGTNDAVVAFGNSQELTKQWCNVNGTDYYADITNNNYLNNNVVTQKVYLMSNNTDTAVLRYDFQNIGHIIPIDEGNGEDQGGTTGNYTQDINFYSSYWIAKFFNLVPSTVISTKKNNKSGEFKITRISTNYLHINIPYKYKETENLKYEIYNIDGKIINKGNVKEIINVHNKINFGIIAIKQKEKIIFSKKIY